MDRTVEKPVFIERIVEKPVYIEKTLEVPIFVEKTVEKAAGNCKCHNMECTV